MGKINNYSSSMPLLFHGVFDDLINQSYSIIFAEGSVFSFVSRREKVKSLPYTNKHVEALNNL